MTPTTDAPEPAVPSVEDAAQHSTDRADAFNAGRKAERSRLLAVLREPTAEMVEAVAAGLYGYPHDDAHMWWSVRDKPIAEALRGEARAAIAAVCAEVEKENAG